MASSSARARRDEYGGCVHDRSIVFPDATVKNGKKRETPFKYWKGRKARIPVEQILDSFMLYNDHISLRHACRNRLCSKPKELNCNCLSILRDGPYWKAFGNAVAQWQVYFGSMEGEDQKKLAIGWSQAHYPDDVDGRVHNKRFPIPFLLSDKDKPEEYGELRQSKVCVSSLLDLIGKGKDWWRSCTKHAMANMLPSHKLIGRVSNNKRKFDELWGEALDNHFQDLKKEAAPLATRLVREKTGQNTLRDHQDDTLLLGPDRSSKRRCYAQFCF